MTTNLSRSCGSSGLILLAFVVLTAGVQSVRGDDVPIRGDANLLRVVHDMQITSESQYQRGSLTAEIHDEWTTSLHSHSLIKAVWENDSVYWEADYHLEMHNKADWDPFDREHPLQDSEKEITDTKVIWLETPRMSCSYFPGRPVATVRFPPGRHHDMPIFQFLPRHVWLTFERSPDSLWSRAFDPQARSAPLQFVVRENEDREVIVERHFERAECLQMIVSLAMGGNVTSYEHTPADRDQPRRRPRSHNSGRFKWEQHPSGTWVVREVEQTRRYPEKGDGVFGRYRMKLLDYDPDPEIPKDRFDLESLKFPPGTEITELRGGPPNLRSRRFQMGSDGQLPQPLLDTLAEELKLGESADVKDRSE